MEGIDEQSIVPYFQPIVCVDSGDTYGYEILGRYIKDKQSHSLGSFFHNPVISALDKVRVDRIIRGKALNMMVTTDIKARLFLNIQPEWLIPYFNQCSSLPTIELLDKYNINGEQIVIEICEDYCGDINVLLELIKRYRDCGCKIAIDDVGEGFSNLERIALLRPDYLKIGANLIQRSKSVDLLEAMGKYCQKTGISLVLEEVEDMEQFQMGLDAGVRYFQGFLLAVPKPYLLEKSNYSLILNKELEEYLDQKISLQHKQDNLADEMNILINAALGNQLSSHFGDSPLAYILALLPQAPDNWLKLYICQSRGQQLTPNVMRDHQLKWIVNDNYIGRNWCWRPYFFSKVAEVQRIGSGVLSEPYLDLETRQNICTFIFPINENLFLFIDCKYI